MKPREQLRQPLSELPTGPAEQIRDVDDDGAARSPFDGNQEWLLDPPMLRRPSPGRSLALALLVGVLVGALLGGLAGASNESKVTSSALIQITPRSTNMLAMPDAADLDATLVDQLVSADVAYLGSSDFRASIQRLLNLDALPSFTVTQQGRSPVVKLSATASSEVDANKLAQAAIDIYSQRDTSLAQQRTDAAVREIDRQIAAITDDKDPLLGRLRSLRTDVLLNAAKGPGFETLKNPSPDMPYGSHVSLLYAVIGALVGVLVAIGALMWSRKLMPRMTEADAAAIPGQLLGPVIDIGSRSPKAAVQDRSLRPVSRTLLAQLGSSDASAERTIVVLGSSPASGSSVVASLLYEAAAERGKAVLANSRSVSRTYAGCSDSDELALSTIVIDGGSVANSGMEGSLEMASDVILVARMGVDKPSAADTVAAIARKQPGRFSVVLTTSTLGQRIRGLRPERTRKNKWVTEPGAANGRKHTHPR